MRFLELTLDDPCYGDPAYTYCDAEKEIQRILKEENVLTVWEQTLAQERENKEYSEYMRLKNKFETSPPVDMDNTIIHDPYKGMSISEKYLFSKTINKIFLSLSTEYK